MTNTATLTLEVQSRECTGTAASRRIRRAGNVPVVMYSHGKQGTNLVANAKEITACVHTHGVITIKNTTTNETTQAIVKDVAYDAITLKVMHVDLQEVHAGEVVSAEVEIVAAGTPVGLSKGGILEQVLHTAHVRCASDKIPESIVVDVSGMNVGTTIHFGDIVLPEGVTSAFDKTAPVFVVAEVAAEAAESTEATA